MKVRKLFATILSAAFLLVCFLPMKAEAAELAGIVDYGLYRLRNAGSGKYLTVHNGLDVMGTNVYQMSLGDSDSQIFRLQYKKASDAYMIYARCSQNGIGRYLEADASGNIVLSGSTTPGRCLMDMEYIGNGQYRIAYSAQNTLVFSACGTSDGAAEGTASNSPGNVTLSAYTGSVYQKWYLERVMDYWYLDIGFYFIKNVETGKYLDVYNGNTSWFTPVNQYTFNGQTNQKWRVARGLDGHYRINSALDQNLFLNVSNGGDTEGRNAEISGNYPSSDAQNFEIIPTDAYTSFRIVPQCSNRSLCLGVSGSGDNASVQTMEFTGDDSQKWVFEEALIGKTPAKFDVFLHEGWIDSIDIKRTSDGFFLCFKSLGDILLEAGVPTLYNASGENYPTPAVDKFYDDWYPFAVEDGNGHVYGLVKMREQETDGYDGDNPSVSIPFINFEIDKLFSCVAAPNNANKQALYDEIDRVILDDDITYSSAMRDYFSNPASDGSYLIAEQYVEFLASTAVNGSLPAPDLYFELPQNDRIPTALLELNQKAGYTVFSFDDGAILLQNSNVLTSYEKAAILMLHTNNVTFNSFAAEVKFHSDKLAGLLSILSPYYNHALRADMGIGEEYESGFFDKYYGLESSMIQEQIRYHGEF